MNDIRRVIRAASWRLWIVSLLKVLAVTISAGLVGVILARMAEKTFSLTLPWREVFIGAGAGAGVLALGWSLLARRRASSVAREVDERAGLRESLSTALCVASSPDPWAKVVVETAGARARQVRVAQAIPIQAPRFWPVPIAAAMVFALVWYAFPTLDLFGKRAAVAAEEARRDEVKAVRSEIQNDQQKLREMLARTNVEFKDEKAENEGLDAQQAAEQDPESLRRAAVKQLTNLAEKLQDQRDGEKQAQLDALREAMQQLKQPGPGPLDELSRNLARGDFQKAREMLDQLQKQMGDGSLSPDKSEQLKQQLQNMAGQLEKLAQNQDQIAKKLEQAGLDKQTAQDLARKAASDPEAVKQALEKLDQLSAEQVKQMMEMMKSQCQAGQQCEGMSQAMSQMAQGLSQEGMSDEGLEGMEKLAGELSDMELLESDMEAMEAALSECKAQLAKLGDCLGGSCSGEGECEGGGIGQWRPGSSDRFGNGSGGPGKGNGGLGPEDEPVDFAVDKTKANTQTRQGPIIGQRQVYAEQIRGESTKEFAQAVEAASQNAADAMEGMQIPRELHSAVKHYFGTLEAKVKAEKATAPAPPAQPAPPATGPARK